MGGDPLLFLSVIPSLLDNGAHFVPSSHWAPDGAIAYFAGVLRGIAAEPASTSWLSL
jgi:hypothetical protein